MTNKRTVLRCKNALAAILFCGVGWLFQSVRGVEWATEGQEALLRKKISLKKEEVISELRGMENMVLYMHLQNKFLSE